MGIFCPPQYMSYYFRLSFSLSPPISLAIKFPLLALMLERTFMLLNILLCKA